MGKIIDIKAQRFTLPLKEVLSDACMETIPILN